MVDSNLKAQPDHWEHFVTPKADSGNVTLVATVTGLPQGKSFTDYFSWVGGTAVAGNATQRTVSRATAAKTEVKIVAAGNANTVKAKMMIWVVWATGTITNAPQLRFTTARDRTCIDQTKSLEAQIGFYEDYIFTFTILPKDIISDSDRPSLEGGKKTSPPGENSPFTGTPLAGGANNKWDVSRRVSVHILNPNLIAHGKFSDGYGSLYNNQPKADDMAVDFPSNDVVGNDDTAYADEANDPYSGTDVDVGNVASLDRPSLAMPYAGASEGNTLNQKLLFGEFLRLEIADKWYRVSDFLQWKMIMSVKFQGGAWVNDGSSSGPGN